MIFCARLSPKKRFGYFRAVRTPGDHPFRLTQSMADRWVARKRWAVRENATVPRAGSRRFCRATALGGLFQFAAIFCRRNPAKTLDRPRSRG